MSGPLELHLVSKAELADDGVYDRWVDPDRVAPMTPEKRGAILTNPLSDRDDDPVQIIGTTGKRVIGRLDIISGRIDVAGAEVPCLWGSELFVPPEFRKTLMGLRLLFRMHELNHTVASCGVSRQVFPIFEKLGWLDFAMPRFVLPRRSRSVVERYLGAGPPARLASAVADAGLRVHRVLLAAFRELRTAGLRTEQVPSMARELDELLRRHARPVAPHRSAAWINWLLSHSFRADARDQRGLFHVYGRRGRPVAYFLVKSRFWENVTDRGFRNVVVGSLRDWAIFDRSQINLRQVILFAMAALEQWDVDVIEVSLPADVGEVRLRRWGFARAGELHLMLRTSPESPLARREYQREDAWRIRPAEGDHFFW